MDEVDHAARTAAAVADEVVSDVVAQVKAHPQYQQAVDMLSQQALSVLLRAIGIGV